MNTRPRSDPAPLRCYTRSLAPITTFIALARISGTTVDLRHHNPRSLHPPDRDLSLKIVCTSPRAAFSILFGSQPDQTEPQAYTSWLYRTESPGWRCQTVVETTPGNESMASERSSEGRCTLGPLASRTLTPMARGICQELTVTTTKVSGRAPAPQSPC